MNTEILNRILSGSADKNIRFEDLIKLINSLPFTERIKGDHHIFTKNGVKEIINKQPLKDNMAKAYPVKQARNIILKYHLKREE